MTKDQEALLSWLEGELEFITSLIERGNIQAGFKLREEFLTRQISLIKNWCTRGE